MKNHQYSEVFSSERQLLSFAFGACRYYTCRMLLLASFLLPFIYSAAAIADAGIATQKGTVQAAALNVRARRGTSFEVVDKLQRGDEVQIIAEVDGWFEILVPRTAAAWCAARFLDADGVVLEETVRVRSGPGIVFSHYAVLSAGDKATFTGAQVNGWQPIEPPEDATVWVSSEYILVEEKPATEDLDVVKDAVDEEKDKEVALDASSVESGLGEEAEEAPLHEAGKADALTANDETEKTDEEREKAEGKAQIESDLEDAPPVQGVLLAVDKERSDLGTHILAKVIDNKAYPQVYLRSSRINLDVWEHRLVRVHGREIRYRDLPFPVMIVRGIERVLE